MSRVLDWLKGPSRAELIARGGCVCFWNQGGGIEIDPECPQKDEHLRQFGFTEWVCRENGDRHWFREAPPASCDVCGSTAGWVKP